MQRIEKTVILQHGKLLGKEIIRCMNFAYNFYLLKNAFFSIVNCVDKLISWLTAAQHNISKIRPQTILSQKDISIHLIHFDARVEWESTHFE